jgi:dolichyl-phosphate beta-glucosyltransferase
LAFLSIVIPAYNEENRLPATLARLDSYIAKAPWGEAEVLIVDDGSTDGTAALVEDFANISPAVRLVRNPGNRGKGYAVRNGMLAARGEWVLFSDADLSTPIEEVEKLIAKVREANAAGAIGSRALDRKLVTVHQSAFREYSGRFFNLVMRLITGLPYADTQCGFKLFRRDVAHEVFSRVRIPGFGFDVEALFIAQLRRHTIVEVPVRWANAEGTKVTMLNGLQAFTDLLVVRLHQLRGHYD